MCNQLQDNWSREQFLRPFKSVSWFFRYWQLRPEYWLVNLSDCVQVMKMFPANTNLKCEDCNKTFASKTSVEDLEKHVCHGAQVWRNWHELRQGSRVQFYRCCYQTWAEAGVSRNRSLLNFRSLSRSLDSFQVRSRSLGYKAKPEARLFVDNQMWI